MPTLFEAASHLHCLVRKPLTEGITELLLPRIWQRRREVARWSLQLVGGPHRVRNLCQGVDLQ